MGKLGKSELVGLLQEHGALLNGHFRLSSGLHSSNYIQTAVILQYPYIASKVARSLAAKFPQDVNFVCSPALGAVVIGQEVARAKKCRAIFTERAAGAMSLRRDFSIEQGEKCLIVEDVLTTGRSTGEVVSLVRSYGAKVIGVAAIIDRSVAQPNFDVPFRALLTYPLELYPPEKCDFCKDNIPLTAPGSKYLEPNA